MSRSRSPSPSRSKAGWSTPSLISITSRSDTSSPNSGISTPTLLGSSGISWDTARAKSDDLRRNNSFFFSRSKNSKEVSSLPLFQTEKLDCEGLYVDKDDLGREKFIRSSHGWGRRLLGFLRRLLRRRTLRVLTTLLVLGTIGFLFFWTSVVDSYRRSLLGRGPKFVVIVGSNTEGGVMALKGAREWAIERNSIWNKQQYAKRWGYELEVVNMMAQRRYSHEWREGWEKVDLIRDAMNKHPDAEWFWWLDLNTWIMESSYSLQDHIFSRLDAISYTDINTYNPANIGPPPFSYPPIKKPPVELILSQDCGGFNLGSFFIRRSPWTERLLDIWWDPVVYEQKHTEWEHNEQNALEYFYEKHPWIRHGVAFLPQRFINSFPPGACGDGGDPKIHYQEDDHDFVVNMAGCQLGRDCLDEMKRFSSQDTQLKVQKRCMDSIKGFFRKLFKHGGEQEDCQKAVVTPWPSS